MKQALSNAWIGTRPFRPVMAVVIILFTLFAVWQPGFARG